MAAFVKSSGLPVILFSFFFFSFLEHVPVPTRAYLSFHLPGWPTRESWPTWATRTQGETGYPGPVGPPGWSPCQQGPMGPPGPVGLEGPPGPKGKEGQAKNWKQCAWKNLDDNRDYGLLLVSRICLALFNELV